MSLTTLLRCAPHRRSSRPLIALLPLAALCCASAQASDADDRNFFRFGGERVIFHDDNAGFQGPGIPPGAGLQTQTENLNAIYLAYARALDEHWEVQFGLGIPPNFHIHARGPDTVGTVPYNGQPLSSGRLLSPSLAVNYKFNAPGAFYRPYLGVGVVYSHFYDIHVTPQASRITGGPTSATYSDAVDLRATAGVSLRIAEHWYGNLSITKANITPTITLHTMGVDRNNDYNLSPVIYSAALSYGF